MQVHARSFESLATDHTVLPYPAPLANRALNPASFEYWWKMLDFVFGLPDPATFPRLPAPPVGIEAAILARYLSAAEEMAESALLNGADKYTVHVADDGFGIERIEATGITSKEIVRGCTTLFRQFDSPKDPARFSRVQGILREADGSAADEYSTERLAQLKVWGKACGLLHRENLKVLVGRRLRDQGRWPATGIPGEDGKSPKTLISAYQYGDLIHWADGGAFLANPAAPYEKVRQRMSFLEAVVGLAHLYIGFSLLVRAAISSNG